MEPTKGKVKKGFRRKKKVKYNVLFVPDVATAEVRKFSIRLSVLSSIATTIILIIALLIVYCYFLSRHIVVINSSVSGLKSQIEKLTEEKNELQIINGDLQEKIVLLSDTVSEKLQAEEERQAEIAKEYIPSGFPLSGTATFDEDAVDEAGNSILSFIGGEGTNVIAAAKGVVLSVTGDDEGGYTVTIDHQNGYNSIYINATKPKVSEGDEVTSETIIYTIESGKEKFSYQILYEGEYIDPMSIMEVYG